jgi:hypothetical protein
MPNAGTSTLYWTYVVATNDTVFVSPTGWYTTSSGTVGSCSIIGYSANGASWSTVSAPRSAHWYNAMSDGNKFLITTSTNCYGAYSLDGKSWTSTTPLKEGQFGCYFKGIFYVGDSGEYYCYTEDCINWVQLPYGFKANWGPFAASDEMMIKVMNNGKVAYTFDGVTWVETPMITSNSWASVCYGDGIFLAVEGSDTTTAAYSTNGIDWTILELPEKQNWTCGFGDHKFVILSGCKPTDDDLTSPFIYNDLTLSDKYDITLEVIVMKEDEQ